MKKLRDSRVLGIILATISFAVIILTSFTKPIESDYERCERIQNEVTEQIRNTTEEGIQKFSVRRENDGRIEITIWALRGFGADEYRLMQHTWLDSYGKNIETTTYRENFVTNGCIIDFA